MIEQYQRRVGIFRPCQLLDQSGQHLGQLRPRHFAAQRTVPPGEPMTNGGRSFQCLAKAHFGEAVERRPIVDFFRKLQRGLAAFRRELEQLGIVPLHLLEMAEQDRSEFATVFIAKEARETFEPFAVVRQSLGLFVVHHLQPMLDRAQEQIRCTHVGTGFLADPAAIGEFAERC